MIAEIITPDSLAVASWLGCLFFLVAGVNQVMKLVDRTKISPPPEITYQIKGDYATRSELFAIRSEMSGQLHALGKDVTELRAELKTDKEDILRAGEVRGAKIHDRIDDVLESVSELRGAMRSK